VRYFRRLTWMIVSGGIILISCALSPLYTWADSKQETLEQILHDPAPTTPNKKALVFFHGTIGDPQKTWTGNGEVYWPALVTQDIALKDFDVFTFGFYSPVLGEGPSVVDTANQLNSLLKIKGIVNLRYIR